MTHRCGEFTGVAIGLWSGIQKAGATFRSARVGRNARYRIGEMERGSRKPSRDWQQVDVELGRSQKENIQSKQGDVVGGAVAIFFHIADGIVAWKMAESQLSFMGEKYH